MGNPSLLTSFNYLGTMRICVTCRKRLYKACKHVAVRMSSCLWSSVYRHDQRSPDDMCSHVCFSKKSPIHMKRRVSEGKAMSEWYAIAPWSAQVWLFRMMIAAATPITMPRIVRAERNTLRLIFREASRSYSKAAGAKNRAHPSMPRHSTVMVCSRSWNSSCLTG